MFESGEKVVASFNSRNVYLLLVRMEVHYVYIYVHNIINSKLKFTSLSSCAEALLSYIQ
jgi:hypothetical protein